MLSVTRWHLSNRSAWINNPIKGLSSIETYDATITTSGGLTWSCSPKLGDDQIIQRLFGFMVFRVLIRLPSLKFPVNKQLHVFNYYLLFKVTCATNMADGKSYISLRSYFLHPVSPLHSLPPSNAWFYSVFSLDSPSLEHATICVFFCQR